MLLYFPGRLSSEDLYHGVLHSSAGWLAANGIEEVSQLQISMVGWREGHQCYVADPNGSLAPLIFDRLILDGGAPSQAWAPRSGTRVFNLPDRDPRTSSLLDQQQLSRA